MDETKKINKIVKILKNRWFIFFATGFFMFILLFGSAIFAFESYYKDKIYPGIKVDDVVLGGKTYDDGLKDVRRITDILIRQGLFFSYKDKEVVVSSIITSAEDPDIFKEVFYFDLNSIVNDAYKIGRSGNKFRDLKDQFLALLGGKTINSHYFLNEEELLDILKNNFSSMEDPGKDATLDINFKNNKFVVNVESEKLGKSFDYKLAIQKSKINLANFKADKIELYMKTDYPVVKKDKADRLVLDVEKILNLYPIELSFYCPDNEIENSPCANKEIIKVSRQDFIDWISFTKQADEILISTNKEVINNYLKDIAAKADIQARDAKFMIEDGKVSEFQESKDGSIVSIEKTIKNIEDNIFMGATSTAQIIMEKALAKNSVADVNDLGINELIGVGKSNFAGSPANRRHNIKVGAETLNGLLIAPNEEFQLVPSLGSIDSTAGYLQELVIKGTKTVPEYGGGLCQIATTAFRVALDSGLPILERRSHAYRVSYYEPAGTDATIYDPKPDFRFMNNTGHYLLLKTRIEKDDLFFELWGTADGRKVEMTEPKISNIISPGPTKIIETEDLKPGEKKCTETSHNGADAEFTRTITYLDGTKDEEVWFSKYRPWQAVCLVGKEKEIEVATSEVVPSITPEVVVDVAPIEAQ